MKIKKIKIISYNLKYHKAFSELDNLVSKYNPDILCIQECRAYKLPASVGGLILGDHTPNARLNIAIYYRKDRFFVSDSSSHVLKKAFLEWMFMPQMERLLVSKIFDRENGREITIGSFHATSHVTSNRVRRNQIRTAHSLLVDKSEGSPTVMVGDYNYLLFKKGLKVCVEESGYQLKLSDRPTYYLTKYFAARYDMATSMNAEIERILALPKSLLSDHTPILIHVKV